MSTPLFTQHINSYVTQEQYNNLENRFKILEAKFEQLCSALDISNTDSQNMTVDSEPVKKVVEVYPDKDLVFASPPGPSFSSSYPSNEVTVSSFSQRPISQTPSPFGPNTSSLKPFPPQSSSTELKKLPVSMNISPPVPSAHSSPPCVVNSSIFSASASPSILSAHSSPPKADFMNRSYTIPFPKVNLKSLASDTLHVVTDYGSDAVLLHGYEACIKLKDQYLKPIGFRFSNELLFGAGWAGTKAHYAQLREQMRKNNNKIQVDEFLMDQITK